MLPFLLSDPRSTIGLCWRQLEERLWRIWDVLCHLRSKGPNYTEYLKSSIEKLTCNLSAEDFVSFQLISMTSFDGIRDPNSTNLPECKIFLHDNRVFCCGSLAIASGHLQIATKIAVMGRTMTHITQNQCEKTKCGTPSWSTERLKNWLPKIDATVLAGRKISVKKAIVFMDLESCCVTRWKDRLITLAIRLSRLRRRSFVEWKRVSQCSSESRICSLILVAEVDSLVRRLTCSTSRSKVWRAASDPSRRCVMCLETLCKPAKSIIPAIWPRVAWLSTFCEWKSQLNSATIRLRV